MKKKMIWVAGILIATSAYAQTDVSTGIMRGKDYGVTYLLPKTEIEIVVQATKHTYMPGEFCKYADRYLRMNNVSADPNIYWTIDKVQTHVAGVPDKDNVYFVKLKDKTVAPLMELTEDGIVRSINIPLNSHTIPATKITAAAQETIDPRKFLTEEILMASSRAKMAELVAKEIYNIRESKNALLRGEADNMPQDGAQLKIMLDNLNLQERAMTEMFSGTLKEEPQTFTIPASYWQTYTQRIATIVTKFSQLIPIWFTALPISSHTISRRTENSMEVFLFPMNSSKYLR